MITTLKTNVTPTPIEGAVGLGNQKYSTDFEVYNGETIDTEKSAYGVESEVSSSLSGTDLEKALWKKWVMANDGAIMAVIMIADED